MHPFHHKTSPNFEPCYSLKAGCLATVQAVRDATLIGGDVTGGLENACSYVSRTKRKKIHVRGDVPLPQNGYLQWDNPLCFTTEGGVH